ncbi:hypothetical protein Tco_0661831 [Tanacetum coccineum]
MSNIFPTLPTLDLDLDFTPSHDSLGSGNKIFDPGIFIEVQSERLLSRDEFSISFIRDPLSPVFDTLLLFSSENEDKVFKPGILSYLLVSHQDKIISDFFKNPMIIYGGDIPHLDVPYGYIKKRAKTKQKTDKKRAQEWNEPGKLKPKACPSLRTNPGLLSGPDQPSAVLDSIDLNGATRNTTCLRPFCFTLHDQAINWLDRLPAGSISTWDDLITRESLYDAWNRFKDLLRKVPHHGLDLWLQVQIFHDHVNYTTQMTIDDAAGGRLRKLRPEEAWKTIEDLAQYEEEEWNDPTFSEKRSPDYIDTTLEHELESMECRVESLMRNEVLLEYEIGFTFPKRPYQEELEARILKLIDDQEDQIRQL